MYISFYFKLTMNCMKKQGGYPRKKKKFFHNCIKILKIERNVAKIGTKEKTKNKC